MGDLQLLADQNFLWMVAFGQNFESVLARIIPRDCEVLQNSNAILTETQKQLNEYFLGLRKQFSLPTSLQGSEFQKAAWNSLMQIPYGSTFSYSRQAEMLNNPGAARAVGTANKMNPLCIVIPCHRVVAKSGRLSGYAGGEAAKEWLLKLEYSPKRHICRLTSPQR